MKSKSSSVQEEGDFARINANKSKTVKANLQKLVASHTVQLEAKNQSLSNMAFSNAHYLRAPLTNIMAIIEMMKADAKASDHEIKQLESLAAESIKLDKALHKVNQLLDD
ncbi:hypothetical protein [Reichenbachiella ulvae]|uniref:Signal transduction histidine kinase dimerisation/phosphoacceptor domain-containing protein n=1 Tax=Reichenbachiella ulvae TaxID=2980104 RepID=A0ABT3D273_9BACT|nr:hypothetical protein [Reichenbachiella ulvae]MCV9389533.1 hypothetical protein [Reichenbachiella ulvae]